MASDTSVAVRLGFAGLFMSRTTTPMPLPLSRLEMAVVGGTSAVES
jgi:hypothetical protein